MALKGFNDESADEVQSYLAGVVRNGRADYFARLYGFLIGNAQREVLKEAQRMMASAESVREYTSSDFTRVKRSSVSRPSSPRPGAASSSSLQAAGFPCGSCCCTVAHFACSCETSDSTRSASKARGFSTLAYGPAFAK